MASRQRRDMRWELQQCLASYMRYLLKARHSRDRGISLCRALTHLSLLSMEWPIRAPDDLTCVPGLGSTWVSVAKGQLKKRKYKPPSSDDKPFVLAAPAMLVALLEAQEEGIAGTDEDANYIVEGDTVLVPVKEIVRRAAPLCDEHMPDLTQLPNITQLPAKRAKRSDPTQDDALLTASTALRRLDNLVSMGYVKRRQRRSQPVYHLTELGMRGTRVLNAKGVYTTQLLGATALREKLRHLRTRTAGQSSIVSPHSTAASAATTTSDRTSTPGDTASTPVHSSAHRSIPPSRQPRGHLHGNDTPQRRPAVVLLVDSREGGGRYHLLKEMCAALDRTGVTFRTEALALGDYGWKYRGQDGGESMLPVLVERKRLDDLSDSLVDGRFVSQCTRMMQSRDAFPSTQLHYIVEGTYSGFRVGTCCARGCISKHGQATESEIEAKLQELRDEKFTVHRTTSFLETVHVLATLHTQLVSEHIPPMAAAESATGTGITSAHNAYNEPVVIDLTDDDGGDDDNSFRFGDNNDDDDDDDDDGWGDESVMEAVAAESSVVGVNDSLSYVHHDAREHHRDDNWHNDSVNAYANDDADDDDADDDDDDDDDDLVVLEEVQTSHSHDIFAQFGSTRKLS
ncbi:hypothetical protein PTSG_09859 [Salpingoeca rosetta]|uniref:Crossover junction endonuclease MUS81 n=1 Tax=Salpingoeca rosetta (strain ATCC 50818 / BSB-021) TaxID=946362 RepID=F2UNC4_SALR5|nr:uncharacterized protein PTSG_09859 [Salpingoeca rosetta]EGD79129.1 hypothetical protein PTSG_09859 [Salpingoeca rosetta]|eukprot:XP_004989214.1 hypothetical protein PTSG_09859 [Salpingoeca rosetta]